MEEGLPLKKKKKENVEKDISNDWRVQIQFGKVRVVKPRCPIHDIGSRTQCALSLLCAVPPSEDPSFSRPRYAS